MANKEQIEQRFEKMLADHAGTVVKLADDAELDRVLAEKFGIVDWRV